MEWPGVLRVFRSSVYRLCSVIDFFVGSDTGRSSWYAFYLDCINKIPLPFDMSRFTAETATLSA